MFVISQSHCASKYDHASKGGSNIDIFVTMYLVVSSRSSWSSFHGRYYDKNEDEKGRSKGFDGWIDASRVQHTQYCAIENKS